MRFSIIVPVYKVEEYLDRCIQSIVAQTLVDFELILVDDGSPDNCPKICDEWAKQDARIKVIHKTNEGVSVARNTGLEASSGNYIIFVDADDWIDKDLLSTLNNDIQKNSGDLISYKMILVDEKDNKVFSASDNPIGFFDLTQQSKTDYLYKFINNGSGWGVWKFCFKREIILTNNIIFNKKYKIGEDFLFVVESLFYCSTLSEIDFSGYYYFQRNDSACHSKVLALNEAHKLFVELYDLAKVNNWDCLVENMYKIHFSMVYNLCVEFRTYTSFQAVKKDLSYYKIDCNTSLYKTFIKKYLKKNKLKRTKISVPEYYYSIRIKNELLKYAYHRSFLRLWIKNCLINIRVLFMRLKRKIIN